MIGLTRMCSLRLLYFQIVVLKTGVFSGLLIYVSEEHAVISMFTF